MKAAAVIRLAVAAGVFAAALPLAADTQVAADVLTVGSVNTTFGTGQVRVPIYLQDNTGTAIGRDKATGLRITILAVQVTYGPNPCVDTPSAAGARIDLTGGILAGQAANIDSRVKVANTSQSWIYSSAESNGLIPFTGAAAPGDKLGEMIFNLTNCTPGTISLTVTVNGGGQAVLASDTSVSETSTGGLAVVNGSIHVPTAEAAAVLVDPSANGGLSDGNGVLEPGETVKVQPSWKNLSGAPLVLTGAASAFTGPAGPSYTLGDSASDYGSIAAGATNNCATATGNCFEMGVSAPGTRPATHWDATFTETLSDGDPPIVRKLHLGLSFTDVPKNHVFYQFVERILHNGVTTGCTGTTYCPDDNVFRLQMAVFIARSQAGGDARIQVSGSAQGNPYNCVSGGQSQFTDIAPDNPFCRHVHYIFSTGVTTGCITTPPRQYCPSDNVTRGQMALFIARAVAGNDASVPVTYGPDPVTGRSYSCNPATPNLFFTDVKTTDIFCRHTHYLWARNVISGFPDGTFGPGLFVTRGAMSKFLANGFNMKLY